MCYVIGTIYRIYYKLDPTIQYVGSTYYSINKRWKQHWQAYKKYLRGQPDNNIAIFAYFSELGVTLEGVGQKFEIEKLKDYLVYKDDEDERDQKHLHAYEQLWINKLKPVNKLSAFNPLNVNKRYNALRYYISKGNMTEEQIEAQRAQRRIENMTEEQIEAQRGRNRIENMTEEQIEKKNAKLRNENLTAEQIEKRNATQRIANMTEEQIETQRARDRVKGKCKICNIEIGSRKMFRHKKTKKHLKNLEEYKKNLMKNANVYVI